jgi:glycerophosphoryl diester phosphodiesterase
MSSRFLPARPFSIAHRGASAYATESTQAAFVKAAELGADMWEFDIRMTADGVPVVHHDATLADGSAIASMTRAALRDALPGCLDLDDLITLANTYGAGLYADIKDADAALPTLAQLKAAAIDPVIIGAFDRQITEVLKNAGCPYPVSALVPPHTDPHSHAAHADVIHLCWENMPLPHETLTRELFQRAFADGKHVVLWHEEDAGRMAVIRQKPVIGICSNRPELVTPFRAPVHYPFQIVCHRGANSIAPENTLPALECALGAGFAAVEVDLHITVDDEIVVLHDPTLDRTTTGSGPVTEQTLAELRRLDAGDWFDPHFIGTRIPTLDETLGLLHEYDASAYLELKSAPPAPVLAKVKSAGLLDRVFFWSFNADFLSELRRLSPDARIMSRRQDFDSLDATIAAVDANIVEFLPDDDPGEIAALRGSDVRSMVAYMGDDETVFDTMLQLRPDMFNLNHPFAFARFAQRWLADE